MKVIIIGGVAAGMSAASKLKRLNKDANITVYEKGNTLSYGACGLPYFISGSNPHGELMIAKTEEEFNKMGIKTNLNTEVVKVDPENKKVFVKDLNSGSYSIDEYDKLLISSGASPIIPPLSNVNLKNIHTLKSYEDGFLLKEILNKPETKEVVIIGGGFIGIEMVETCIEMGKKVRLIELSPTVLTQFDEELAEVAINKMKEFGVNINLEERVTGFSGSSKVETVVTNKGEYKADFVLLAAGVRPNLDFLKDVEIIKGKNGALSIDREGKTSINDIYAAGDCAEIFHKVKQENDYIPLGTTANKLGRIVGENLTGKHIKFEGTLGSSAIKIFDIEMARTGLSEKEAIDLAIDYKISSIKTYNHAPYYPNPQELNMKIIVDKKNNKIIGAQGWGYSDLVLRIDMIAVAIHAEMDSDTLGFLDFAYAPPFANVWDAVNVLSNTIK